MTTLYRPVLIESAEQAEALPVDTLATELHSFACQKVGVNEWIDAGHAAAWSNADMVGWTALVPIEAEETPEQVGNSHRSLYATPWTRTEEA